MISIILVSLNPVWIQLGLWRGATPLALTFWQAAFAAVLYTLLALRQRQLFALKKQKVFSLMLLGLSFFFMALFFSLSLERLSASYTVMLFFSYPLFVLVGNTLFFKEKLTSTALFSLIALLVGVLIITWPQGRPESLFGILLAFSAAVFHAIFIIYSGRLTVQVNPLQVAMFAQYGFLASALFLLPFMSRSVLLQPAGLQFGFILAVLSSFAGFILFMKGVAALGSNKAALLTVTNLPLSLFFAWVILGDVPGLRLLAGFLFILVGLVFEAYTPIDNRNNETSHDRLER